MCPNLGTPKNNFFHLEQMENLSFLGVPILKHIKVVYMMLDSFPWISIFCFHLESSVPLYF